MAQISAFSIGKLPEIRFGSGVLSLLPDLVSRHGNRALILTGQRSFLETPQWPKLQADLNERRIEWTHLKVGGEPSPDEVDTWAQQFRGFGPSVVVGIGGGSVLDAAKALAGLIPIECSVMDFLEGVGPELPFEGPALPWVAVPTTAGTGSEATKNAVLTRQGADGFKKSFRSDLLVASVALIDPELLESCPKAQIAANGMDALTQLLESFVSLKSNPFTDALACSGLKRVLVHLLPWYEGDARSASHMAYASLLSGVCLAQTGLGSVHGLAQPLGSFFPIPHGVVCGTLLASATRINVVAMRERDPLNPALLKYAMIGRMLPGASGYDDADAIQTLISTLADWTHRLSIPNLAQLGVSESEIPKIIQHSRGSSMKTNPIVLRDDEINLLLQERLGPSIGYPL